ncbi:hypothetical protein R1flu_009463 [Riccia fluitans]|uniref:Retrotransposon gag domain-containing protein n=1 Tax=Riccia fluitans TaxID=41844 RepID=A0ABD1Z263_9MARC
MLQELQLLPSMETGNWVAGTERFEFEYQGLVISHKKFYGSWLSDDLDAYDKFREWIYKTEKFFSLAEVTEERKKIYFAGVKGLAGGARQWFLWNSQAREGSKQCISTWDDLRTRLKKRFFCPRLLYEKSLLDIISIVQTANIDDYYWKFFRLRHNLDFSERALTCLFTKGLKRWLRAETMDMMVGKDEPSVDDLWKRCRVLESLPGDRKDRVLDSDLTVSKDLKREEFELTLVMSNGVTVKIEKILKFSGSIAPDDLDAYSRFNEWCKHMENFFSVAKIYEEKKKLLECSKSLGGEARQWFAWRLAQAKEGLDKGVSSWESLKSGLRQHFFSDRLLYKTSLLRIISLEQIESIHQSIDHYYDEFTMLMGNLDFSEQALTWLFFRGLRGPLKAKMEEVMFSKEDITVEQLWERARVLESIISRTQSVYGMIDDGDV